MPIAPQTLLRAKLQGIRTTLERTPPADKKNRVALALLNDFNDIMQALGEHFPDIASALPKRVTSRSSALRRVGQSEITFLDLEALCEQALNLLALVDDL